jgi:hypothetical protein
VRIDQRVAEREVLRHPDEGVVHRVEPVRVVAGHDLTDGVRGLAVRPVGPHPRLVHRPQDPAVDRLQAVSDLRQRAPDDDRHRVVEVGALDLLLELHGLDPAGEQVLRHRAAPLRRPGSGRTARSSRCTPCATGRPRPSAR